MPSNASVHVNAPLSAFCAGYSNNAFIGDKLFPVIETEKIEGTYFSKSKADVTTVYEDIATDSSSAPVVDYATSQTDFKLVARHLKAKCPYVLIDVADDPLRPREDYAATVMQALLLAHERRLAVIATTTTSYTSANRLTASAVWSNETSSAPVADVQGMIARLSPGDPGKTKLVGGCALETVQALAKHPSILGLRGALSPADGQAAADEIAKKLMLDELWVSDAEYATSARGATLVTARVWDKTKFVVHRVPKSIPKLEQAQSMFGCSFRWQGPSQIPFVANEWDDPDSGPGNGSLLIKVSHWTLAGAIIQNDMGAILSTVLA
jgi:hypothetical protein